MTHDKIGRGVSRCPWDSYPWWKKAYLWCECYTAAVMAWPVCVVMTWLPWWRPDSKRLGLGPRRVWYFLRSKAQIGMGKYRTLTREHVDLLKRTGPKAPETNCVEDETL